MTSPVCCDNGYGKCHNAEPLNPTLRIWEWAARTLKKYRDNRASQKTFSLLLEHDDYILRDIGINRNDIYRLRAQSFDYDPIVELQRLRRERLRNPTD
ncbi:DUF1127 domain-containing protein [Sneathiella aquimaris]|uniref:DUF1127 domain-containing protein n=1 Tax=Sneathiella aquimaris TaxID=2599305 RepID=UPI00146B4E0C|nr:DUF1127 domain-containing protein [Sneathiella aquimaris]